MIKLATPRSWRDFYSTLAFQLFRKLKTEEVLTLNLESESSLFIRLNNGKIRQMTDVEDTTLLMDLMISKKRRATAEVPLKFDSEGDFARCQEALFSLREEASVLPTDPFSITPPSGLSSEMITDEQDFGEDVWLNELIEDIGDKPLYGLVSAGRDIRAMTCSNGTDHWFQRSSYTFDHSLRADSGRAIKGLVSGTRFDRELLRRTLGSEFRHMLLLQKPSRTLEKGNYRVYLAPQAVGAIMDTLTYAFGEGSLRRGTSGLRGLREGRELSPLLNIYEHSLIGLAPRFNEFGELATENFPLIEAGQLKNTLIGPRTALEYNLASNGARGEGHRLESLWGDQSLGGGERLRVTELKAGSIKESDVLEQLGRGIYIGQLHYLNWSDRKEGRITGMTRFDCFWVEDGKLVAPIERLRFDDSIYRILGSELLGLTEDRELIPDTSTYERRHLGGYKIPGALIQELTFTL